MSFNATTLNMAEKRTAETRSKLSPITDDATKNVQEKISEVDPGLAILPIIGKNVQFSHFFPQFHYVYVQGDPFESVTFAAAGVQIVRGFWGDTDNLY